MSAIAKLDAMPEPATSTRKLAGMIVSDEFNRAGYNTKTAPEASKVSGSALADLRAGKESVTKFTLRKVEGALNMPRYLLDYIIAGDAATIRGLDMDADLKRSILAGLNGIESPRSRRASDRPTRTRKTAT